MRKFIAIKEKVSLYSNQITFNYSQKCHPLHPRDTWYKEFPQKKKKQREKERKEVEKRRIRKGMERVCAEGKGKGRMRGGKKEERKEKEKKGEKERERNRKWRERRKGCVALSGRIP